MVYFVLLSMALLVGVQSLGASGTFASFAHTFEGDMPDSIDWRESGIVPPVADAGYFCGSSWAFVTASSIASVVLDCSSSNYGCQGGDMRDAYTDIVNHLNGRLCSSAAYPYTGKHGQCKSKSCSPAASISGYIVVASNNEVALKRAVTKQPVAVAIASKAFVHTYRSGVFSSDCPIDEWGTLLDRAMLVVGYGTDQESGQMYWIVQNTMGKSWGESGYIRILRSESTTGLGHCGIAMYASVPNAVDLLVYER